MAVVGEWALLTAHLPGNLTYPVGILLRDVKRNELHIRIRNDWSGIMADEDAEVLSDLAEGLAEKACEQGAVQVLDWLDSTLSHILRISPRQVMKVEHFPTALDELYQEHVTGK
jgi:hypothetical protein